MDVPGWGLDPGDTAVRSRVLDDPPRRALDQIAGCAESLAVADDGGTTTAVFLDVIEVPNGGIESPRVLLRAA